MSSKSDLTLGFYYVRELVTNWILESASKEEELQRREAIKHNPRDTIAKLIKEKNGQTVELPEDLSIEILSDNEAKCYLVLPEYTNEPVPGWV